MRLGGVEFGVVGAGYLGLFLGEGLVAGGAYCTEVGQVIGATLGFVDDVVDFRCPICAVVSLHGAGVVVPL